MAGALCCTHPHSLPGGMFALIEWEGEDTASVVSCLQVGGGVIVGQISMVRTAEGGTVALLLLLISITHVCRNV